ncbi:MAG TPA: hypothetical protein VM554_15175 [Acidisarcina sp.]|nr:hypothetical protein [Acidisarcina sp.]
MAAEELITINIGNVSDGALVEAFDLKLREVLANIADPTTSATAKREIVLRLELRPKEDRVQIDTQFTCVAKLSSITPNTSRIFLGQDKDGGLYALNSDPRQLSFFTPPRPVEAPKPLQFTPAGK